MDMLKPLEKRGYERRKSQEVMANKVLEVLKSDNKRVMISAGTGTGKTFAYLIPSILEGKKVVVSTCTKILQEQILRDVKELSSIYGKDVSVGILKGISSYVCKLKLREKPNPLLEEMSETTDGDITKIDIEEEDIKDYVVKSKEDCDGCMLKDCYHRIAKNEALKCDILVVNHHLLCLMPNVLKGREAVIIDEAHELPDILIESQAIEFSEKTIKEFVKRKSIEEKDLPDILPLLEKKKGELLKKGLKEVKYISIKMAEESVTPLTKEAVKDMLSIELSNPIGEGYSRLDKAIWKMLRPIKKVSNLIEKISLYIKGLTEYERIIEEGKYKRFRLVPLFGDINKITTTRPIIMTSATLEADYMEMMLGMDEGECEYVECPKEWIYDLDIRVVDVNPKEDTWKDALVWAVDMAKEEFDKVIVLLTNRQHLSLIDTPLKQGKRGLKLLVEELQSKGGVLVGVDTFWKGIDVRGNKALVIGKLPFRSPEDQLFMKRCEFLKKFYGDKVKWKYIKAVAKMDFKQGLGRLKRGREDTGVVYLVDNRIFQPFFGEFLGILKEYGKINILSYKTKPAIV